MKKRGHMTLINLFCSLYDYTAVVDYDYFETLKTAFVAGRPFSREFASDIQGPMSSTKRRPS
jgi:hypothetical protein